MTCDCLVEMDVSFDNDVGVVAAVRALLSGTVHECVMRADVVGADLPLLRILRNLTNEDGDEVADGDLELLAFDPRGPFVESTVGRSGVGSGRRARGQSPSNGIRSDPTPKDRGSIQLVDSLCDGNPDGFLVSHVQAVEVGIRVAELCGVDRGGRGPEGGLPVVERSQSWNERYS